MGRKSKVPYELKIHNILQKLNIRERKIICAYENKYSFMAMIKILSQCQEGVFFMSKLSKELIRQIIADGEFSTPNDIGEYLKDMFKDVIQEMLEKELVLELGYEKGDSQNIYMIKLKIYMELKYQLNM